MAGGACEPQAELGTPGKWVKQLPCTWKRSPLARIVYGSELIAAGLDGTRKAECEYGQPAPDPTTGHECKPPTSQVQANADIVDAIFGKLPMQPRKCDAYGWA